MRSSVYVCTHGCVKSIAPAVVRRCLHFYPFCDLRSFPSTRTLPPCTGAAGSANVATGCDGCNITPPSQRERAPKPSGRTHSIPSKIIQDIQSPKTIESLLVSVRIGRPPSQPSHGSNVVRCPAKFNRLPDRRSCHSHIRYGKPRLHRV